MASAKTNRSSANFDALFGSRQGEKIASGGFQMLAHDRITVRPQVRRTFAADELGELRGSIRELRAQGQGIEKSGVLQALLVCPDGDGYRLSAGEKRFRATKEEGLNRIPCVIVAAPDCSERNSTPRSCNSDTIDSRCGRERPSRSSFHTTSTSPASKTVKARAIPGRSLRAPESVSQNTWVQPARSKASSCKSIFCSSVETRA